MDASDLRNDKHATPRTAARRAFLKTGLGAAGGLLLSFCLPSAGAAAKMAPGPAFAPNAYLRIGADNSVTVVCPFVEMGQGAYTSIPMLLAEELEVDLANVRVEHAPADEKLYGHPLFGAQLTGASASVRGAWEPMRKAGASARLMLVSAAASTWGVEPGSCTVAQGVVTHQASGRKLTYGELAAKAATMPPPTEVPLKPASAFRLVGTPAKRLDIAAKVNGTAKFGIDAQAPGMKVAAVAACPVFGGKLASVDDSKARAVKGVRKVVKLDDAVAVIADHTGAARKGLAALAITWDEGPNARFSGAEWERQLEAAMNGKGLLAVNEGGYAKLVEGGARQVEAVYMMPFLAHATMEPMNCTAHVRKDGVDIWTGTQAAGRAQDFVAKALNVDPGTVRINNFLLGGGFGRRLEVDYIVQAALIARQVSYPVKVVWSREEDMQHDYFRPLYRDELAMALDAKGKPVGFRHRFAGSAVEARYAPAWMKDGIDTDAIDAAASPYDFAHKVVEFHPVETAVPTGFWRGVGPTHNTFVIEGFMDELAAGAKADPLAYRRAVLSKEPRALAVLELAAQKAGWGKTMAPGTGMGLALAVAWGSYAACVVEAAVDAAGQVNLKRVVSAIDCGQAVNTDGVIAQIESGSVYGLTAALYGKLTLENGRVMQGNFHDYPVLRMNEVPPIEVHLVQNGLAPGGVGEIGCAMVAPALVNAVFAATGKRLRRLPVEAEQLKQA
ncbi:xanthine dehydrogenase family protein molybdopterin-binding subunit [Massilia sp. Root351]|uniref:xanthine dehydrogenase family protein molybdopterin-binding subunit n=1 Tax=Massilia sp. Root351 TaxID=1736522 RepID=UPI000A463A2E|nr:xanthine dehydrogenase family protein molybdopterin-binding subunit [Massilia sp. Root351]